MAGATPPPPRPPARTLVVWCPDWPVVAADPTRDARAFEPVAAAAATLTPRVEIVRPGTLAFPTRGPSRYFGGDAALAARVIATVTAALAEHDLAGECRVGVADGPFAATLAARATFADPTMADPDQRALVVPSAGTAAFLAPLPVTALGRASTLGPAGAELAGLLRRLGLRTLGDLAALPAPDVLARFGPTGALAHRLSRGLDERPPAVHRLPPDLTVTAEIDPPAERVDAAAFVAKSLADELHARLRERGLACARVLVEAETEHGEHLARLWRHEGALTSLALAERVRWQLDGWLTGPAGHAHRPTAGITILRLVPDEVAPAGGHQLGFWGGATAAAERAARAVARLEGLLGPEAVVVARPRGGRAPGEQVVLVPWSLAEGSTTASGAAHRGEGDRSTAPWPGRVPPPAPAIVPPVAVLAEVVGADGEPVRVTGRGVVSAAPTRLSIAGDRWADLTAWAGPWPADERWWDPPARRRRARIQVVTTTGAAHLLALEGGRWHVEATYD